MWGCGSVALPHATRLSFLCDRDLRFIVSYLDGHLDCAAAAAAVHARRAVHRDAAAERQALVAFRAQQKQMVISTMTLRSRAHRESLLMAVAPASGGFSPFVRSFRPNLAPTGIAHEPWVPKRRARGHAGIAQGSDPLNGEVRLPTAGALNGMGEPLGITRDGALDVHGDSSPYLTTPWPWEGPPARPPRTSLGSPEATGRRVRCSVSGRAVPAPVRSPRPGRRRSTSCPTA